MSNLIKKNLSLLFSQISLFVPHMVDGQWNGKFLVNENNSPDTKIPKRDDLLHMIGLASVELTEFIREYKQAVDQGAAATKLLMETFIKTKQLLGQGEHPEDFMQLMEVFFDRYVVMANVMHSIAHDLPSEKCKEAAQKFFAFKPERFEHLVNQKNEDNATSGQPVLGETGCTCKGIQPARNQDAACPVHGNPEQAGLRVLDEPAASERKDD